MTRDTGTECSISQELFIPDGPHEGFHPGDTEKSGSQNLAMSNYMSNDQRGAAALARFIELAADIGYHDKAVISWLHEIAQRAEKVEKKAVEQWVKRGRIPAYAIFNIAAALDVDIGWLSGSSQISKEKAIRKGGAYSREQQRFHQMKQGLEAARPRRRA